MICIPGFGCWGKFQKAESDLDYIEHKLEFEIVKSLSENATAKENPVKLLEQLSVMKSRHKALCTRMEKIAEEQKDSVESIRSLLTNTMKIVQQLQQQTDLEVVSLTEEEQTAAELVECHIPEAVVVNDALCVESSNQQKEALEPEFQPICDEMLTSVPRSIKSTVKLADLNVLYKQLFDHFIKNKNSAALSVMQMTKMNMKPTDAKLKTLKHLSIIELDKKGYVKICM
ncbi:spindle and kinetochore-associated protein 2 isoform X2 [Latimeria chalumnae]|uniref:spindle and kinetochore-associated protein 2 isoform X2 n=1 Tax=Latimeria chalumnae TaxID=7897 RepID=UPI0003C189BA|nr:PREDICTED: spindle and kinetochore-associated protein 2 isoform X2 [Latimeria chalumnae]|eukprot:XP_005986852.1 PREDICTED: spindle and kinetochore-associated protein 2 isoform X2 [Latimeria chalumnae]